jgi:hypothetical protein
MVMDAWNQRWKSQIIKIHSLAAGFSKDYSTIGLAYGFLSQNHRFLFAICNLLIICCVHNLILTFLSETLMKKNENKQNSLLKFRPT